MAMRTASPWVFALGNHRPLSPKQEMFVAHYLGNAHGNAMEAARMSGYKHAETSSKANMRNPIIRERIKDFVAKKFATADEVLSELTDVGMAEWRDFIAVKTNPKTGEIMEVKMDLSSKVKSLDLLGKYHGLFVERREISGPDGGPIPITTLEVMIDKDLAE